MLWTLALNSLWHRSLRSLLTSLGIAVAVGSTVIFLSLGEGLRDVFSEHIAGVGPDIQVSYGPFDMNSATSVPQLPLSYGPELEAVASEYGIEKITPLSLFVRSGLTPGSAFLFMGLPPDVDVSEIYTGFELLEGRALKTEETNAYVGMIGQSIAERNNIEIGKVLRLNPRSSFEIVGIVSSEDGFVDNAVIVPIDSLTEAIGVNERTSFFVLELAEPSKAADIAEQLSEQFPELGFQTRSDVLSVIERGIRITDVVRLGISIIALIVGAIAIANTMLMSVFERTREFGVIRAVGAKAKFLFSLVLSESILLSLVGALFGIVLGYLGILIVNYFAVKLIALEVAVLTPRLVLFSVLIAFVMGLFSGLLPAARAARIPIAVAMSRE